MIDNVSNQTTIPNSYITQPKNSSSDSLSKVKIADESLKKSLHNDWEEEKKWLEEDNRAFEKERIKPLKDLVLWPLLGGATAGSLIEIIPKLVKKEKITLEGILNKSVWGSFIGFISMGIPNFLKMKQQNK